MSAAGVLLSLQSLSSSITTVNTLLTENASANVICVVQRYVDLQQVSEELTVPNKFNAFVGI